MGTVQNMTINEKSMGIVDYAYQFNKIWKIANKYISHRNGLDFIVLCVITSKFITWVRLTDITNFFITYIPSQSNKYNKHVFFFK